MKYLMIYLAVINTVTMSAYFIDKQRAKKNQWRISEATLIGLAVAGGFIGAFAGMQLFRHKTKHIKFVVGVPIISIIWMILLIYGCFYFL